MSHLVSVLTCCFRIRGKISRTKDLAEAGDEGVWGRNGTGALVNVLQVTEVTRF